ncbi:hypothetical protein HMPREF9943_00209 [Eggerthia catenaformis OT 569 = DSM 20559]|uniref:HTH lacI-type domain-containing protein n=1 Tax=Eggerthia catenaformis OT 569 = DSM 20559 TaxID=999415 RepID=M2PAN5_9FIRM|nr:LacI family DNA-binding transcriptional regulator [Eggerthia catenaformis]EMD17422.1 hypothetical protein HMPREF9943_00209 [Eggerthia catenaformis OT 569 = DSM 20559]
MEKKKLSIIDIAHLANVSQATVSRVINKNGRFSEKTGKKVEEIIKKYGYETNMTAKSLRIAKSKTIGLIVPSIENEWFASLISQIETYFFQHNYSVFICNTSRNKEKEISYFKSLDAKMVDGIICITGENKLPIDVLTRDIPIVCTDRVPAKNNNVYIVSTDHYRGGYIATKELIKKGCKRICIIVRNRSISVNEQRFQGYLQALKDHHLPYDDQLKILISNKEDNFEGAKRATLKLIENHIHFDGIFGTNDWRAYGAIVALQSKYLRIPEDVKVVGFDNITISKVSQPPLTTINQDTQKIAVNASKTLLDLMNNPANNTIKHIQTLPVHIVKRKSTENK